MTGSHQLELPTSEVQKTLVAALAGDRTALLRSLESASLRRACRNHRLVPALALRARALDLGEAIPTDWQQNLQHHAARSLLFEALLEQVASCLAAASVEWVVIKGMDLATRVYSCPEERPAADIDILIEAPDYRRARSALEDAGWSSAFPEGVYDAWVQEEGHAWTAVHVQNRVPLEVHFRLWGMVPEQIGADMVGASLPDPLLPTGGRRLPLAHAFVLGAMHALLDAPPRPLLQWWDLERIAGGGDEGTVSQILELTRSWGVELLVVLAAAQVAALWPSQAYTGLIRRLARDLRWPERQVARSAARRGLDATGASMSVSRLLAGRPTRMGWKGVQRRFWAHPGMVAQETPSHWLPARRRIYHVLRAFGFDKFATWAVERRA